MPVRRGPSRASTKDCTAIGAPLFLEGQTTKETDGEENHSATDGQAGKVVLKNSDSASWAPSYKDDGLAGDRRGDNHWCLVLLWVVLPGQWLVAPLSTICRRLCGPTGMLWWIVVWLLIARLSHIGVQWSSWGCRIGRWIVWGPIRHFDRHSPAR